MSVQRFFVSRKISDFGNRISSTTNVVAPTNGLIAYYALNGNGNDSVGSFNLTSTNITWISGKTNSAADFNGSSSQLYRTNTPYVTGNSARSVSMWVNLDSAKSGQRQLLFGSGTFGTVNQNFDIEANVYEGSTNVAFYGIHWWGNGARFTGAVPTYNEWTHLVVVHDGGDLSSTNTRLYINGGEPYPYSTTASFSIQSSAAVQIGAREYSPFTGSIDDLQLNGAIDEIRIYNRSLSSSEANQLYLVDL